MPEDVAIRIDGQVLGPFHVVVDAPKVFRLIISQDQVGNLSIDTLETSATRWMAFSYWLASIPPPPVVEKDEAVLPGVSTGVEGAGPLGPPRVIKVKDQADPNSTGGRFDPADDTLKCRLRISR